MRPLYFLRYTRVVQQPILILDIDSSSVGACVLDFFDKPQLSSVMRVPIGTGLVREPGALLIQVKEALARLIPQYARQYPGLTSVAIVLASPWFAATVKRLNTKSEKPVKVSQSSIRSLVSDFRAKNPPSAGHTTLEALPITVEVNGYRTRLLSAVHGSTLAVTFYESFTDQTFIDMLRDVIRVSLAKAKISIHTTPLAYAETLLRLSDEEHATIIDVGGEVTDVVVLSHQRIAYVGSLPIGSRTIARSIGGNKDSTLADAQSRLALFARAELTQKEMQVTSAALTTASAEWQKQYLAVLNEAGNSVPLSHRVFVTGERDELAWFTQVISGAESRGQRPVPTVVDHSYFLGMVTYGTDGLFDSSLVLDSLFFHMQDAQQSKKELVPPVLYSVQ